ncbi:MAG: pyridoxamine 5-phosphate oxidase [Verrucomicrobiota bacterium]
MSIADLRREYCRAGLRRKDLDTDPIVQFEAWFEQARAANARLAREKIEDVNAMTLATADEHGRPSARIVLLKGIDQRGFLFFTNYESRKGKELSENPQAAAVFYWPDLERQVCIAGEVARLSRAESEAYFKSRPRGSKLATWASTQSEVIPAREVLEQKWKELETKYPGEDVPLPPYWGGYVLTPARIEFWQGRPNRLHDRFRYSRLPQKSWQLERLAP